MVREMAKEKRKNKGLTEEKDYITEAYLQGGKAIGEITKKTKRRVKKKAQQLNYIIPILKYHAEVW